MLQFTLSILFVMAWSYKKLTEFLGIFSKILLLSSTSHLMTETTLETRFKKEAAVRAGYWLLS